ncbi:MAG: sigma-70 family RNA polymerase sigma factor [Acidobacteria bacterium]|nr:sigma-70 family RNA polymerase sigma factor [Acidobacteriota bacterium]
MERAEMGRDQVGAVLLVPEARLGGDGVLLGVVEPCVQKVPASVQLEVRDKGIPVADFSFLPAGPCHNRATMCRPLLDHGDDETMEALKSHGPDPERQAFAGELRTLLESAIEALPGHYRAVFVMREVEGMSTAETAACLEITEETAKTRLHRARTLLRDDLYQRAGVASAAAFPFEAPRCDRVVAGVFERIEALTPPGLPRPN